MKVLSVNLKVNMYLLRHFYDGTHHLHHQYQFHLEKPESKENMKRVLLFLSRNTSSSGVERGNNHSLDTHTPENNTVNLLPIE